MRQQHIEQLDRMQVIQHRLWHGYDAVGNVLTEGDAFSQYASTYDVLNRLSTSDNAGAPNVPQIVLTNGYDAVANRTSVRDDSGVRVDSVYDARNQLSSRSWTGGGIDPARAEFADNTRGQVAQIESFADAAGLARVGRSTFGYDSVGMQADIVHRDATNAIFADYDYHFDLAGQLTCESHHGQTSSYAYNANGELTSADHSLQTDETYSFDATGNRNSAGSTTGANNQLPSDGTFNYQYDNEGNLPSARLRKAWHPTGK